MNLIRKYIRFYKNNVEEMRLYDALCDHKTYGFLSASDMMKEALRRYLSGGISAMEPDELVDLIVKRLQGVLVAPSPKPRNIVSEEESIDNDVYDAAMSFLDSL
ncbi:MAG: hypothetical protein K5739_01985 [Lachnospiraceae bacterium]|nr:hypothetical protein [Lachnospiraceae bacterium]